MPHTKDAIKAVLHQEQEPEHKEHKGSHRQQPVFRCSMSCLHDSARPFRKYSPF